MRTSVLALVALGLSPASLDASPRGLRDDTPQVQKATPGRSSQRVSWRGTTFELAWNRYTVADTTMWHPQIVMHGKRGERPKVLFEATNDESVYWGEPLRVVWLARGNQLLVRLVEVSRLGSPAYAACIQLAVDDNVRVVASAQPGRDAQCPAWAKRVVDVR